MNGIATNCTGYLVERLRTVEAIAGRVFEVQSEEELVERIKGVSYPCVGVAYDGILPVAEGPSGRTGVSAEVYFSVMVFFRANLNAVLSPQDQSVVLLDQIRGAILATKSPTGHVWRFKAEVPISGRKGLLVYVQRWATPCQLVG